jgi:hypothetical protein
MNPVHQYNPVIDPILAPTYKRRMDMNGHGDSIGNENKIQAVRLDYRI